jgi:hypothetical protein
MQAARQTVGSEASVYFPIGRQLISGQVRRASH